MRWFAHGVGGPGDLPIPAEFAIAGATAALAVSFTVLALAWRTPRFNVTAPQQGFVPRVQDVVDSAWFIPLLRVLTAVFAAYVGWAAIAGDDTVLNPFISVFYVLLWVGIVPMSLLFGPFYKAISPARAFNGLLARLSGSDPEAGLFTYPQRLGYWPAALGLLAFVWLELVYPFGTELGPVRLWCATYIAAMLLGGAIFGNRFYEHADPFEVYSTLVGHLSPWGRHEGRLVLRSPLQHLDQLPVRPGLVPVCAVLLGSTAYDSFSSSEFWLSRSQSLDVNPTWLDFGAMMALILIVGLSFSAATMLTGIHDGHSRWHLPGQFAHSLVPIIVGYVVAHYLSYFVEQGQQTLIYLSDPLTTGANYLGTADWEVNRWLSLHPRTLASIKVLGVVVGHIVAVVSAHDRAVRLLPTRHQLSGQLPLLFVMVGFTVGGLYLLFGA